MSEASQAPDWWRRPRRVTVLVDNESWILPHAETLVGELCRRGDDAALARSQSDVGDGDIVFLLGCIQIVPAEMLARNRRNLVVHESELPEGRGFSPLTWQVIEGRHTIPVCLFEATDELDAGPVIYRDAMELDGHELVDELRALQASKTIDLCLRFLSKASPPAGVPQRGESRRYRRRTPQDSRLDPDKTLHAQFDLLRTIDNERYPAFFDLAGHRYRLRIEAMGKVEDNE
jgi:methionyl-tRNA formyltransferase